MDSVGRYGKLGQHFTPLIPFSEPQHVGRSFGAILGVEITDDGLEGTFVRINVHGQVRIDEGTHVADAFAFACFKEKFFFSFKSYVQRAMSSRIGKSDDVVLDLLGLHYRMQAFVR
ncbi:unnamed protein product [Haemonchus placei]|uniref:YceI domain-containing protein n=1 Tax=Haemonchus placei TaxID=6290 RepID=A0A0N4W6S7_HAEPC|nr:unnamed protein product [Haemonchus placei]